MLILRTNFCPTVLGSKNTDLSTIFDSNLD